MALKKIHVQHLLHKFIFMKTNQALANIEYFLSMAPQIHHNPDFSERPPLEKSYIRPWLS